MSLYEKYIKKLHTIPSPGGGGCHVALLGVANLGIIAGLEAQIIHDDLRQHIPPGSRRISDTEIKDAINKAVRDYTGKRTTTYVNKPKPSFDGPMARTNLIKQSRIQEVDIFDNSPVRMEWTPSEDTIHFLQTVFNPDDRVFIGTKYDASPDNIRTVEAWIKYFQAGGSAGPLICINPLSGEPERSDKGGVTYRGKQCVRTFKHCLAEFDNMPLDEQYQFWFTIKLPIKALIHTGNKSIHAWIDVPRLFQKTVTITTLEQWDTNIKNVLFDKILEPLGADVACKDTSRLARLPGVLRTETDKYQKLLWLSRDGRKVRL